MTWRPKAFRSVLLIAGVAVLGGFQCPATAPPMASNLDCKTTGDSSKQTQTIRWGADSLVEIAPDPAAPNSPTTTILTVGGQTFFSSDVAFDPKSNRVTATAHFGKAFSGMREMVLSTVDGKTFDGTLDGKALKPLVKGDSPQTFADGSPLPPVSVDDNAQKELAAFVKALQAAPDACKPKAASANRPLYAGPVPGHSYNRIEQATCEACVAGCIVATGLCIESVSQCARQCVLRRLRTAGSRTGSAGPSTSSPASSPAGHCARRASRLSPGRAVPRLAMERAAVASTKGACPDSGSAAREIICKCVDRSVACPTTCATPPPRPAARQARRLVGITVVPAVAIAPPASVANPATAAPAAHWDSRVVRDRIAQPAAASAARQATRVSAALGRRRVRWFTRSSTPTANVSATTIGISVKTGTALPPAGARSARKWWVRRWRPVTPGFIEALAWQR